MIALLRSLIGLAAFLLLLEPATAASEFCAARVARFIPIHNAVTSKDLGTDTAFGFTLSADSGRTVDATLAVYAGGDLYELSLRNVVIAPHSETVQYRKSSGGGTLVHTVFESEPFYAGFAAPKTVDAAWLSQGSHVGASSKDCPTMPVAVDVATHPLEITSDVSGNLSDETVRSMASASPPLLKFAAHVDAGNCLTKFTQARPISLSTPAYPTMAQEMNIGRVMSIIEIALDSTGKVVDAWVFGSSGVTAIDLAALNAAKTSEYSPAKFLCVAVPGSYTFRADFAPSP